MRYLDDMALFFAVAKNGSFTKASERLDMPKSTVSRRISLLEERLGVSLLERSTRNLRLTNAGKTYLEYCEQITEVAKNASAALAILTNSQRGTLKISASLDIGRGLITPYIQRFRDKFPEVELSLIYSNRRIDLIEEGFDLAIRIGRLEDSSLIAKNIGNTSLKFFASKKYLALAGVPETLNDLSSHTLLLMSDSMPHNKIVLHHDAHQQEIEMRPTLTLNDFLSLRDLVKDGAGITLLPDYLCRGNSALTQILKDWSSLESPINVLYPSQRGMTPILRGFINFMQDIRIDVGR